MRTAVIGIIRVECGFLGDGQSPVIEMPQYLANSAVVTQNTGTVCYEADFPPYGQERAYTNTCTQNPYKFEGKERDSETQNDEFGARNYSWRFGRWLSADWSSLPVPVPYANLANPQTLNLYAMVADDPESFADLDGHEGGATGSGNNGTVMPGTPCTVQGCKEDGQSGQSRATVAQSSNQVQPQKHHPKPKPKPKPKLYVKANPAINNQRSRMLAAREVDYHSVTANGEYAKDHVLGLKEKCAGHCAGLSIAASGNEQRDPALIHEGEYEDRQEVYIDHPYTIEKRWSIDGQPAQVLDPDNTPFDYEILHNTNDSTPHFQTEYKNDSPR
jgi:RHS repeat-associated protein